MTSSAISAPLAPAGALLGITSYTGGSDTGYGVTGTSFADVDATNLVVSFVAPPSGNVLVTAMMSCSVSSAANNGYLSLREGASDISGTSRLLTSDPNDKVMSPSWLITGLTPGSSHSYKLGAKVGGGSITLSIFHGPTFGQIVLSVYDAGTSPTIILNGITVTGTPTAGQVPVASSGTAAAWGSPTQFKYKVRTAGDISLSATSWTDLDTGLDITLNAKVGDVIEIGMSAGMQAQPGYVAFDVVTVVGGSAVNSVGLAATAPTGTTSDGIIGWFVGNVSNYATTGQPTHYTVVSGDLSSGQITLRVRYWKEGGTTRVLYANSTQRLEFWAKNLVV